MMNCVNAGIPVTSVSDFTDLYSRLVIRAVNRNESVSRIRSVFLWGAPGVGKSQGVRELASIIEKGTGKTVQVTDVRLLLMNPIDLHGIPTSNVDKTATVWLKPKLFDLNPAKDVINILFLDELSAAPQSVQAAAYQLVLDRKIGEFELPDNTIVIGAGNRITDYSVAYRMPKALANRFSHFEIQSDIDSWQSWASEHHIHPLVTGYLGFDSNMLSAEPKEDDIAYPSPRTWEFVSDMLGFLEPDENLEDYFQMISSFIGIAAAQSFISWAKNYSELPNVVDILAGKISWYPDSPDAMYSLASSIATYVSCKNRFGLNQEELESMASYVNGFPSDYSTNLYMDLIGEEGMEEKLRQCPSFKKWVDEYPDALRMISGKKVG